MDFPPVLRTVPASYSVAFLLKGGIDFMTAEEYRALLDVDFNNVKIEDLTDIRKIKIDKNQPQSKRQAQFLKQVAM